MNPPSAKNLAGLIASAAPKIGSAISGSAGELVGNIAKNIITSIFGVENNSSDEQIINAIKANPLVLVELKKAELEFEQKLREAELEFDKIIATDKDSARKLQIATGSKFPEIMAVFIIGFTCMISYQILTYGISEQISEMVAGSVLQLFMSMSVSIIGYFYGSSIGSRKNYEFEMNQFRATQNGSTKK